MKNEEHIWELVENKKEEFINFSDRIFDTPEILYQEFKSVSEHINMLTREGFKVTKISEINRTLKSALKIKKPVVIDVDVDPKALYSFRRDTFKHRTKK